MRPLPSLDRLNSLLVYEPDTGILRWREASDRWGRRPPLSTAGYLHAMTGYMRVRVDRVTFQAHRIAYAIHHGRCPSLEIDHINGVRTDNRAMNLREVTTPENQYNRQGCNKSKQSSKLLGVYLDKRRWRAAIRVNRVLRHLGFFDTPEQAHAAYLSTKASVECRVQP